MGDTQEKCNLGLDVIAGRLRDFMGEGEWATEIEESARYIERLEAENKELKGMNRDLADAYKWSSSLLQKKENLISDIIKIRNPFFVSRGSKRGFQTCKEEILSIINAEGK